MMYSCPLCGVNGREGCWLCSGSGSIATGLSTIEFILQRLQEKEHTLDQLQTKMENNVSEYIEATHDIAIRHEEELRPLKDLLAAINGDGGHHASLVGVEQACLDAADAFRNRGLDRDRLAAQVKSLSKQLKG